MFGQGGGEGLQQDTNIKQAPLIEKKKKSRGRGVKTFEGVIPGNCTSMLFKIVLAISHPVTLRPFFPFG
jgi:hypothetical protein